jgi:hypothetical protein
MIKIKKDLCYLNFDENYRISGNMYISLRDNKINIERLRIVKLNKITFETIDIVFDNIDFSRVFSNILL